MKDETETLELPKVPEIPDNTGDDSISLKRIKSIEYTQNGKLLSEDEVVNLLNKWQDFVCNLVPQTEVNANSYVDVDPTPKNQAIINKQSLMNHLAIFREDPDDSEVARQLIDNANQRIESAPDTGGGLVIQLIDFRWKIQTEGSDEIISSLDIRFTHGEETALVWVYNENGSNEGYVDVDSWIKGVYLYIQNGKEWLATHRPGLEIPDVPDLQIDDE